MAQIPIISGIYSDASADYRTRYPHNLVPVPKNTGQNRGYLGYTDGIEKEADAEGESRGGLWNERQRRQLRVIGETLHEVLENGSLINRGSIAGSGRVTMTYSFNSALIVGNNRAWIFDNNSVLTEITDADLGEPIDGVWIDGYYVFTDREFILHTELNDETAIEPLKYGTAESDPDGVSAVGRVNNELAAFGRHTTEFFDNVGGTGFAFQRIESARLEKGVIGTHAKAKVGSGYIFVGGGRDENVSVWTMPNLQKVATREIEEKLAEFTESELSTITMDQYSRGAHQFVIINMPDGEKLVLDVASSQALGQPAWHTRSWDAQHPVFAYGEWWVAGANAIGKLAKQGKEWGQEVERFFEVPIIYADNQPFIINRLELSSLPGRTSSAYPTTIGISHSSDGVVFTPEKWQSLGARGQFDTRVVLRRQGKVKQYRNYRFRIKDGDRAAFHRLDLDLEPLNG
jgi:hypothetical protein